MAANGASSPGVNPKARFGQRLGAVVVDIVLLWVVQFILIAVIGRSGALGLSFLVGIGYYVYFEGSPAGQTIGKRLVQIRVVDFESGGSIDYGRAFVRYIGRIISSIPLFLGYFWMLWDPAQQTWHDKIARTAVVPAADFPPPA